jgi:hypothetical protein
MMSSRKAMTITSDTMPTRSFFSRRQAAFQTPGERSGMCSATTVWAAVRSTLI